MAKCTIYIPENLRSKMEAHHDINWSQIAQNAFEKAIKLERVKPRWYPTNAVVGEEPALNDKTAG